MDRLAGTAELLDGPLDPQTLSANLRDLARINRWLGGTSVSWQALAALHERTGAAGRVSLLDVGTGAADIPLGLLARAERSGLRLAITATDVRPEIVDLARGAASGISNLTVAGGEPERIRFPDNSFDVVHCSLVMHHLEPAAARVMLGEMRRVARRAVIVNDLDRKRRWWVAAWLLTRLVTTNRYTRHDGPLSVRRSYRPNELSALAAQVGLREVSRWWARPPYRYALSFLPR
ncbi:MAG: methyltransferase domain-containing protein [Chloroflexota bacterium]|nr:methyltransferase domain-containing protein [Chloroflexota bacterium]